jgi:hypothetical protein
VASLAGLPQTAAKLLADFIAQLEQLDVEIPERRYVASTPIPVWDGEQLTVSLSGMSQGQPGAGFGGTFHPSALNQFAQFAVQIVRKVSVLQADGPFRSTIPTGDEINADGLVTMGDAAALWTAAARLHFTYAEGMPGTGFEVGPLQTVGPEGGLAGVRLLLSLTVD